MEPLRALCPGRCRGNPYGSSCARELHARHGHPAVPGLPGRRSPRPCPERSGPAGGAGHPRGHRPCLRPPPPGGVSLRYGGRHRDAVEPALHGIYPHPPASRQPLVPRGGDLCGHHIPRHPVCSGRGRTPPPPLCPPLCRRLPRSGLCRGLDYPSCLLGDHGDHVDLPDLAGRRGGDRGRVPVPALPRPWRGAPCGRDCPALCRRGLPGCRAARRHSRRLTSSGRPS